MFHPIVSLIWHWFSPIGVRFNNTVAMTAIPIYHITRKNIAAGATGAALFAPPIILFIAVYLIQLLIMKRGYKPSIFVGIVGCFFVGPLATFIVSRIVSFIVTIFSPNTGQLIYESFDFFGSPWFYVGSLYFGLKYFWYCYGTIREWDEEKSDEDFREKMREYNEMIQNGLRKDRERNAQKYRAGEGYDRLEMQNKILTGKNEDLKKKTDELKKKTDNLEKELSSLDVSDWFAGCSDSAEIEDRYKKLMDLYEGNITTMEKIHTAYEGALKKRPKAYEIGDFGTDNEVDLTDRYELEQYIAEIERDDYGL